MVVREVLAKSILGKSGISDYCVNCYTGCTHACVYCYARYMKRFTNHPEPWGTFLDVKTNAPERLFKEVRRHPPGHVFLSSVCDCYQPAERKYELTRRCLKILLETGYQVGILTKNALVTRDIDIMRGFPNIGVGMTLTTMDEDIRREIEPSASPTADRIAALSTIAEAGIPIHVFLGPFLPYLTDTEERLDRLIAEVAKLPIRHAHFDKLNPRPGVWNSVVQYLHRRHPKLIQPTRKVLYDEDVREEYVMELRERVRDIATARGVGEKFNIVC